MSLDNKFRIEELRGLLENAEKLIENNRYSSKRRKRFEKAIEDGYAILNRPNPSNKEVDDAIKEIKSSLMDRSYIVAAIMFSFFFILASIIVLLIFNAI